MRLVELAIVQVIRNVEYGLVVGKKNQVLIQFWVTWLETNSLIIKPFNFKPFFPPIFFPKIQISILVMIQELDPSSRCKSGFMFGSNSNSKKQT
jgi:hypothetical protein